jgi:hypothetical protein
MARLRWRLSSDHSLRHLKNRLTVCTLPNDKSCLSAPCGFLSVPIGNTYSAHGTDVSEPVYIDMFQSH